MDDTKARTTEEEKEEGATKVFMDNPKNCKRTPVEEDDEEATIKPSMESTNNAIRTPEAEEDDGGDASTDSESIDPEFLNQMMIIGKYTFRSGSEEVTDEEGSEEGKGEDSEEEEDEVTLMREMTGVMSTLPLEIILNILSRPPIKTISSCRWVSKSWLKIIRHPLFAQVQHAKAIQNFSPCVTYFDPSDKKFYLVDHEVLDNHEYSTTVHHPKISGFGWAFEVVGACNGLICMSPDPTCYKPQPYFIFNPITIEYINLPKSPMYKIVPCSSAFGFDPVTNQYKVVRILETQEVEIYTLGSGSTGWRSIADFPYNYCYKSVLVNGALHWRIYEDDGTGIAIVALDMTTEEFREIPPPPPSGAPSNWTFATKNLGVLGGCLCFIDDSINTQIEIWVMKSYGVQGSWSKEYTVDKDWYSFGYWKAGYELIKLRNGELMLQHDDSYERETDSHNYEKDLLHYYDPRREVYKPIAIEGIPSTAWKLEPIIHLGSLISPKNAGKPTNRVNKESFFFYGSYSEMHMKTI